MISCTAIGPQETYRSNFFRDTFFNKNNNSYNPGDRQKVRTTDKQVVKQQADQQTV